MTTTLDQASSTVPQDETALAPSSATTVRDGTAGQERRPRRDRPRRWTATVASGMLALAIVLLVTGFVTGRWGARQPEGLVFEIPAGAQASVARPGVDSAIAIPTDIRFGPGEAAVITVRNFDDVTHRAGPFLVGAGQTFVQRFPEPGRYPIACNVNPLESIVVTVEG